ncbi:MAG: hypothetical protein U0L92_02060 [Clostridia bacterium]|nr:hypothetical protein [Clostridia bacterium]
MAFILRLWQESQVRRLFAWLADTLLPRAKALLKNSLLWELWLWVDRHIMQSRVVQVFIDPVHLANAYWASAFHKASALLIRRLSLHTPKALLPWNSLCIGGFLATMLLIPDGFYTDLLLLCLFLIPGVFYFSHHSQLRTGIFFAFVNLVLILFWGLLTLVLPGQAVHSMTYLLLGIDFFFLVSLAIRSEPDFVTTLRCIYGILLILCAVGLWQQDVSSAIARGTFPDGIAFGEIIVLLFPFAFIAPMTFASKPRRIVYLLTLLMLTFSVVTATHSRAALVGFSVEFLLLILLIDWRYLPILLVLAPVMTDTAVENIIEMWTLPKSYGSFAANLFYSFQDFWKNGFGISQSAFLNFYSTTALHAPTGQGILQLPIAISPVYFSFILELGLLALFLFLVYLLRMAHNTLTSIFTAPREFRSYFAAGFAVLVGISVSSLLESTFFSPRTLLTYWGMLGMIRAVRILRYGIDKEPKTL